MVQHALEMTKLHEEYSTMIVELAEQGKSSESQVNIFTLLSATLDGSPINRPVWWLDPEDPVALALDDEFLLGSNILVAPVLTQGATQRDIYLPKGLWREQGRGDILEGPKWLVGHPADLFYLPYFVREQEGESWLEEN